MAESESSRSSRQNKAKESSRAKARIETSHTTKKIASMKRVSPKRFSHTAMGNR